MTPPPNRDFYLLLAKLHREHADKATDAEVRRLHDALANRYLASAARLDSPNLHKPGSKI
jgi:hypothetical protein